MTDEVSQGNGRGKPRSAKLVRELLEPHIEALINTALADALLGDINALRLCLERLCPPLKADSEPAEIPGLADAKTLTDRANAVLAAVAIGHIAADAAAQILAAIASAAQLTELEELKARLGALEARGLI